MIEVLSSFKLNNGVVAICDMFPDSAIKEHLMSNAGVNKHFEIEMPRECFSKPVSRTVFIDEDISPEDLKFINFSEQRNGK